MPQLIQGTVNIVNVCDVYVACLPYLVDSSTAAHS